MENILSCGLCNTKFPNFDNFRTHMKEHLVQSQQKKNLSAVKSNLQEFFKHC